MNSIYRILMKEPKTRAIAIRGAYSVLDRAVAVSHGTDKIPG
jgi:hypothetical protein